MSKIKKFLTKKRIIIIVILIIILFIVIRVVSAVNKVKTALNSLNDYTEATVERRDLTEKLSGSGSLEPLDSYNVTSLVAAEILNCTFEDGDTVKKDDLLYELDSSDVSSSIERSQISLERSQRNYDKMLDDQSDLTVKASVNGTVKNLILKEGDKVNAGTTILTIEDTSSYLLSEYYSTEFAGKINVGDKVTVSVPDAMIITEGVVTKINNHIKKSDTGIDCFEVVTTINNDGSLSSGLSASGMIGKNIYPTIEDADGLDCITKEDITVSASGDVDEIFFKDGESVKKGDVILKIKSETMDDSIKDAKDSLREATIAYDNQQDTLDNYMIKAPIDGTIVVKNYKEGEKTQIGQNMCIIYDMSALTITLNVDELDISKVKVGQKAIITADAVEGKEFEGVVTRVGINGTTGSGVTTFPVDIRLDVTDGLLPGMNVDVDIIVTNVSNVIAVPAEAVERGDKVLVKSLDGTTDEGAPEGYKYVDVTVGVSDGDYVEITSGLSENDAITYKKVTANGSDIFNLMMSMDGGDFDDGGDSRSGGRPDGPPQGGGM